MAGLGAGRSASPKVDTEGGGPQGKVGVADEVDRSNAHVWSLSLQRVPDDGRT